MKAFDYKGIRVPWVTRWTSEVVPIVNVRIKAVPVGRDWRIGYEGPTESVVDDVLWLPENDSQGEGIPMFKDVHSHRQRQCMVEKRCQICGRIIEGPAFFIVPAPAFAQKERQNLITDVTPVCEADIETGLTQCPALNGQFANSRKVLEVQEYRPHAVFGDVLSKTGMGLRLRQGDVRLTSPDLNKVMARQMIVELWQFRRRNV